MAKNKDVLNDHTASIEERTEALFEELEMTADEDDPEQGPDALHAQAKRQVEDAIIEGRPVKHATQDMPGIVREESSALIPNLHELFPNGPGLATTLQADLVGQGADLDLGAEPTKVTLRKPYEPPSLYDSALNPKLLNLAIKFLLDETQYGGLLSRAEFMQFFKLAQGRNIPFVSYLRQVLHLLLRDRRLVVQGWGAPERNRDHDNDQTLENQQLSLLLGLDVYEELHNYARRFEAKPQTAMCLLLKAGWVSAVV